MTKDDELRTLMLQILCEAAPASVTPETIARAASLDTPEKWRSLLPHIKRLATMSAQAGELNILRKGKIIDPEEFKGVIRLQIR